jgi:hypothetical protein
MSMSPRAKNFLSAVNGLAPSWFTRVQWRERVRMRCPHCRRNLAQKDRSSAILAWNQCERCAQAWTERIVGGQPFVDECSAALLRNEERSRPPSAIAGANVARARRRPQARQL